MQGSRVRTTAVLGVAMALALGAGGAGAQTYADELAARVWLDRGDQPLLQRGDQVRLYYRASQDAHVALFHIDTNGTARMLLPRTPDDPAWVVGGRDYRLVGPENSAWVVDEDPGKGYFFVLASPAPFDLSAFTWDPWGRVWELGPVGRQIYTDPYVAMDETVALLIPDWEYAPYALDFLEYDVGSTHDYPRFLCYDCHGFRPYQAWNPYLYSCTTFRVVIWDDPYFYPAQRYVGQRVVWTRPVAAWQPRFEFKERARGEAAVPLVRSSTARVAGPVNPVTGQPGRLRRATPADQGMVRVPSAERGRIQFRPGGAATAAPDRPSSAAPGREGARAVTGAPGGPASGRGPATGATPPGTRPSLQRRPAGGAGAPPSATAPRRGGGGAPPATSRSGGTPTGRALPPRRGGGGSAGPAAPATRRGGAGGAVPTRGGTSTRPGTRAVPPSRATPPSSATPPRRSGGGGAVRGRPPARTSPPVRSAPPPRRGGGGTARSAPPSRRGGGGARPPTRSRGGGGG